VVVVTINHRLNVFGFTYLGESAGADFALSGTAGMLDVVAALQWVRDNIERFGGDPNLVTIFGQSGGRPQGRGRSWRCRAPRVCSIAPSSRAVPCSV
jgi:carboxylesterase type B